MKTKEPGPSPLSVHDNKNGSYTIVTAQGNFYAKTYSELDANRIAAGPDLLAAAREVITFPFDQKPREDLKAAIAKSEDH